MKVETQFFSGSNLLDLIAEAKSWQKSRGNLLIHKRVFKALTEHNMDEPNPVVTMSFSITVHYNRIDSVTP